MNKLTQAKNAAYTQVIKEALKKTEGQIARIQTAAVDLGVHEQHLRQTMHRLGIKLAEL